MYGTEPKVATIMGGKTGFTSQSLYCLVSFGKTDDGREVICVTAKGDRKYAPIYGAIELYRDYTHPN
jgi:D-alanyl-D-alanine carboxypeptidase